jgi:galactokinase
MIAQHLNARGLASAVGRGDLDERLETLYGREAVADQRKRYRNLIDAAASTLSGASVRMVSTPGRTELSGNHTDHNNGIVLAGGIQLDSVAVVEPTSDGSVELASEGYDRPFRLNLQRLEKRSEERGTTDALIRGVAARLAERGYRVGGFRGRLTSSVVRGSGLSSSASVEVLIGTIYSALYNDGGISETELALAGQFAENTYFEKPCGLMDQLTCAVSGIIKIDFRDPERPAVEKLNVRFSDYGLSLCVVDTGGTHANLTDHYADIPAEMRSVAALFGKRQLREVDERSLIHDIGRIRGTVGDRAVLRALHFFGENARVLRQAAALHDGRIDVYLENARMSGQSSFEMLQNCYPPDTPRAQGIPLALALSGPILGTVGAARVHGGGFAGTIQAYVPNAALDEYVAAMDAVFGNGSVTPLSIRIPGTAVVF